MPELRQDPLTRDWVVLAPERGRRPTHVQPDAQPQVRSEADCPFCPGHESETPPELWRFPGPNGGWQARVFENRFPVLGANGEPVRRRTADGFVSLPGTGRHEVLVEMPEHNGDLACADLASVRAVLEGYHVRYQALRAGTNGIVLIFRNHGVGAGSSLAHPHSQIVSLPVVPGQFRRHLEVAIQHFDDFGTCLYLDVLERELHDGRRIVLQTDRLVAYQPYAAAAPYETWIMPRMQQPSFGDADGAELDEFATVLRCVLRGLSSALADPDYNAILFSAPPRDDDRQYFVWHMRIVPRLATTAGFELGTAMSINPSIPEQTAERLRRAIRAVTDR
jgi:UDPglucose--hexose-1-phosphate uridylyltransferase